MILFDYGWILVNPPLKTTTGIAIIWASVYVLPRFSKRDLFSFQDKSESSENECNKKDEYESPASSTGWTGFNGSGSVAMTGHLAGLLAQNGQNGGSSSVNISCF